MSDFLAEPYIETYYRDTLNTNEKRTPLSTNIDTDICVIGGGLAGLSTAIGLTEKNKQVVLIEANRIGWGASGRNGGYIAKGYAQGYKPVSYTHLTLPTNREV